MTSKWLLGTLSLLLAGCTSAPISKSELPDFPDPEIREPAAEGTASLLKVSYRRDGHTKIPSCIISITGVDSGENVCRLFGKEELTLDRLHSLTQESLGELKICFDSTKYSDGLLPILKHWATFQQKHNNGKGVGFFKTSAV